MLVPMVIVATGVAVVDLHEDMVVAEDALRHQLSIVLRVNCATSMDTIIDCWFRFDESFVPPSTTQQSASTASDTSAAKPEPTQDSVNDQAKAMLASTSGNNHGFTDDLTLPKDLDSEAWYGDTSASHHFTPDDDNLQDSTPYTSTTQVREWQSCSHSSYWFYIF